MTEKQYSTLQRLLGVLDGLPCAYRSIIDSIGKIIDEIQRGDNSQK